MTVSHRLLRLTRSTLSEGDPSVILMVREQVSASQTNARSTTHQGTRDVEDRRREFLIGVDRETSQGRCYPPPFVSVERIV